MQKRINALKKTGDRSAKSAASHQVMQAKRMAPVKSGTLRGGIRTRHSKKSGSWSAESWVPGSFKYNMWVNQNIASVKLPTVFFRRIRKWPTRKWRQLHNAEKSWRYAQTKHTGHPGYWNKAIEKTRRHFGRTFRNNTIKTLRVKF